MERFLSRERFGENPLSQSMSRASLPMPFLIALLEVLIDRPSCALTIMAWNQINNLKIYSRTNLGANERRKIVIVVQPGTNQVVSLFKSRSTPKSNSINTGIN